MRKRRGTKAVEAMCDVIARLKRT